MFIFHYYCHRHYLLYVHVFKSFRNQEKINLIDTIWLVDDLVDDLVIDSVIQLFNYSVIQLFVHS